MKPKPSQAAQAFVEPRLLRFPRHRAGYSDRTAWTLSVLAGLAYLPKGPALRARLREAGFSLRQAFVARFFNRYDTQGLLVEGRDYAALVFRGTVATDLANWITDLNFSAQSLGQGMRVHRGFYQAFEPVRRRVEARLRRMGKPLYIAGHSLGGALAVLAAFAYAPEFADRIEACYTFGCPKVGNLPFLERLYKVPIYQVIHRDDLVPHIPPRALTGFHDSGDLRHLLDGPSGVRGVKGWATGPNWFLRILLLSGLGLALGLLRLVPFLKYFLRLGAKLPQLSIVIEDHAIDRYSACLLEIARNHNPVTASVRQAL